jgi:hypothetical protein
MNLSQTDSEEVLQELLIRIKQLGWEDKEERKQTGRLKAYQKVLKVIGLLTSAVWR